MIASAQTGLQNVAEDDSLAAPRGHGDKGSPVPILPVTQNGFFRFSLKGIENPFCDEISLCLHICGLRGIQGAAAQQDSFFARSLVSAKDDPLDLLDPVRTKKAQLLPG